MASVAIDIGANRTKIAVYDRKQKCPVVAVCIPTLLYVPRSGPILVGATAEEAIRTDPLGQIDDLNARLLGSPFQRNRRECKPNELLVIFFTELRRLAMERLIQGEKAAACSVVVPLKVEMQHVELLTSAAMAAGFEKVDSVSDAMAAIQFFERIKPIKDDAVVICDLGQKIHLTLMRRQDSVWRPALEMFPPLDLSVAENGVSQRVHDSLFQLQSTLAEKEITSVSLLLVGGGSKPEEVVTGIKREGWTGEILTAGTAEFAAVLGAVSPSLNEDELECPECGTFPVSKKEICCSNCGYPVRLILENLTSNATTSSSTPVSTIKCPECKSMVSLNGKPCPVCGCPARLMTKS